MANTQFSEPNKVYVVASAITGDINVASGATLIFQGGKISNGKITGKNVTLRFDSITPTFNNVTFNGKFNCDHFYPELFGAVGDGKTDDAGAIQRCIDAAFAAGVFVVKFLPKVYLITSTIYIKPNILIQGALQSNIYRYKDKTTILANLSNPNGFAFDTDIYEPSALKLNSSNRVTSMSNSGKRFDMFHKVSNSITPVYDPYFPKEYYYGGPFNICDIAFYTTNDTFGAIREIGMTNAHLSGILIDGFRMGMYLAKGWNFIVERSTIRVSMFGMMLGAELTVGLFNSVQMYCNNQTAKYTDSTMKFYSTMVQSLSDYSNVFKGNTVRTVGIIGSQTSATFNACVVERFQIGVIGNSLNLVFNSPYFEYLKECIICLTKGTIQLNNSIGFQEATSGYGYAATNVQSKIILNNAHPGSYYPTVADESYNKDYYNIKSYVVTNHNKVYKRMTYSPSTYVDCNVGDTVYVCDTHPNSSNAETGKKENALMPSNLGNYFLHPISFKDAVNRIATDYNYRNVTRIVLVGDVTLNESLNWQCNHPIEVTRDRHVKKFTINAKQNIACDVTFKKLNITLNKALCQTQNKDCINIGFESDTITGNAFIVENTAQQESPSSVVYMSIDRTTTFASRRYFSDSTGQKQSTIYHVMVAGKLVSTVSGATAVRPSEAINTGYCYFDTMLNKPIWWNGKNWVDSLGNSVDSSRYK